LYWDRSGIRYYNPPIQLHRGVYLYFRLGDVLGTFLGLSPGNIYKYSVLSIKEWIKNKSKILNIGQKVSRLFYFIWYFIKLRGICLLVMIIINRDQIYLNQWKIRKQVVVLEKAIKRGRILIGTRQLWVGEWTIVVKRQLSNFSAILWREQVNFQWDYDKVRFVLDQHAKLDLFETTYCPIRTLIYPDSEPTDLCSFSLMLCA